MRPKTKTEWEVTRLSAGLPPISEYQKRQAMKLVSIENARRFRGKKTDISHFIIATTTGGWQVLRHFYLYATYRYKKLNDTFFGEVMQQWYRDGKYVFFSRNRQGLAFCTDAWCFGAPMEIRRGSMESTCLRDPRDLGYDKVLYVRLLDRFKYIPKDDQCDNRIDDMFRALNTHPFNETLYRNYRDVWLWSIKHGFVFDKERTNAIKIAMRHHYDFMSIEWADMIEMLQYCRKDLHNPHFVCPVDIHTAHDEIMRETQRKREKMKQKMDKTQQVRKEREQLRRMEREALWEKERKEREQAMITLYPKVRGKFFNLVIADNELEIKVLQSVQEFMEEGAEMGHCVFANGYYDVNKKPDSLILSAKSHGKRVETIEVDLKTYNVVQCRGKYNQDTPYHRDIIDLMNHNMERLKMLNG